MELKQFSHRELKAINNGNLQGFVDGGLPQSAYTSIWNNAAQQRVQQLGGSTPYVNKIPDISNPGNPKSVTPKTQSLPRAVNVQPITSNGVTENAGTGYESKGPTQADSNAAAIGPWFAAGAWAGGGVLEGIGRIKSVDEHLADAGTSEQNINGIAYTQQNSVNAGKIMSDYDKTTAKDFLTNPFRGIASIFGRSKAKREAQNAAMYANIQQNNARNDAYTKYLRLQDAKKYGNSEDQVLYAANGKLPKFENGLASAVGMIKGEATARVSNGEVIANKDLGTMYRVPGIKNNKDGKLAALNSSDTVITNKYGLSDYVWKTGDIDGAEKMMAALTNPGYKRGKLPKCAEGWLGNFIPSAIGTLASLDQTLSAYKNKPYRPNTYASNPYELEGLTTLAGLRVNPYPIINQLRSAEARTNRAIDIAGGLSGSQRTAARLANLNTTQNNISNLLSNIQQQNNAYRANYAQAAINAGQASRQARMQANQWDLDMYAKAHAARNRGIQTGIANMLSQIQQYQANEFKRRQFNDTMDLYRADQKQRKEQFDWMRNTQANLPYYSLYDNIYGNPIKDNDVIEFDPYGARASRKRLSIGG